MAISRRVKVSTMKIARVIAIVARGRTIGEAIDAGADDLSCMGPFLLSRRMIWHHDSVQIPEPDRPLGAAP
jgi:hypothetical protein